MTGCAPPGGGGPITQIPPNPLPPAYKYASAKSAVALPYPKSRWWREFHDSELDHLEHRALTDNHDLKVAVDRIAQAEAQAGSDAAALYPTLGSQFQFAGTGPSLGPGTASAAGTAFTYQRLPQVSLTTSYELDLWGKNGYQAKSALALAEASVAYRDGVALTLTSQVATTYFEYLGDLDHVTVAKRDQANAQAALDAVRSRMNQGDATRIELLQQETAASNAAGAVAVAKLNRDKNFDKLAALLGTTPAQLSLGGATLTDIQPPRINAGIPAQLICRRPDIRRAEDNLISAHADIKVARAEMYPDFTFSLQGGKAAYAFSAFLLPESRFFSIIGSVTQSIFDAGKNADKVRKSLARYEEMVQTYHQTIVDAVREVEDALAALRLTRQQQDALNQATAHARKANRLSNVAFNQGALDYLTLLNTQRSLFAAEDAAITAHTNRLKAAVDLFKSLGGGVSRPRCQL